MGKKGKNKKKDTEGDKPTSGKTYGAIPTEKLKFATGDNQAEKYEALKTHLAGVAQGKWGAKMAHITMLMEEECPFNEPTLQSSQMIVTTTRLVTLEFVG